MTTTRKPTGRTKSIPVGLALGALTALGITVGLSLIGGKLMDMGIMGENVSGYWAMGMLMLSAFAGAMVAVKSIRRQKLAVCSMSVMIYYITLLGMTALLFGGELQGVGVTALVVLCGGALAAMAVSRQSRGGGRTRRRRGRRR